MVLIMLVVIILLILSIGCLFLARGLAIAGLKAELQRLDLQVEELLRERAALKELLAKKFDPEYIEYLARKELGLIRPGEEKYIVMEGE